MIIQSVELQNFRNYQSLELVLDPGINIFYGDNAQGKTNILESIYVGCTSKSHKAVKDREMIRFSAEEAHIKVNLTRRDTAHRIDMHIKKNSSKGIALNGIPIRKVSQLFGIANVVIFSPEDLNIIKNGPGERRRFMDMELCQLNRIYVHNLISYNKVVNQKNKLLKEAHFIKEYEDFLDIYNTQLVKYGTEIIRIRRDFISHLNDIIRDKHDSITDHKEEISILYEADTDEDSFEKEIERRKPQELKQGICLVGPHRDDLCFTVNGIDIRHFGSQGQQRTATLSLKLAEISLVSEMTGDKPVLLLDDVLSELDRGRQNLLLNSIGGIQTLITCTGLDDFVNHRFHMDKVFYVKDGTAKAAEASLEPAGNEERK